METRQSLLDYVMGNETKRKERYTSIQERLFREPFQANVTDNVRTCMKSSNNKTDYDRTV